MASISAININNTSARGLIQGLAFSADYYTLFEIELWDYNQSTYYYTSSWTDSSSVNQYTYMDFSGLGVGTGYTFKAFAKSGGNRNYIGATSFTTTSPTPVPGGVGTVSASPGTTNLSLSWSAATNAQWYDVTVRVGNSGGTIAYTNSSVMATSVNVTGLSSSTNYWISVKAGNSAGNGTESTTTATTLTPPPPLAAPTNLNAVVESDKVTLTWDAISGATSYSAEIYLQGTSTVVASSYAFQGANVLFGGLSPNTNYTAKVYGNDGSGTGTASYKGFLTSPAGGTRPVNWSWTSLVSSIPFNSTYFVDGVRKGNLVNAAEWNDFCNRINAFRVYKLGAGNEATFTAATQNGTLTPAMYNQAVNAISPMATVSQPEGYYSKLVALKTALNSIS